MYEKPEVQRFGTFRELTKFGAQAGSDIGSVFGITGCSANDRESEFGCAVPSGGSR
ncbi:MAG: hypothetical protein AVDCRST_MAG11-3785 [uncultured Gemmatimonadaceae bacterium]|uniref:RiPP n=1 Tax=uncultured Gemmatimonadaceae bacterium TaxID=246130 RepID=A0A6J4MBI5_9BACT|nr:MAG: hypothetical protein AVDCRST_MAG11-3785 [uncultured Gemmatimonadaceae bacterium]